jgi:hypothetical protein
MPYFDRFDVCEGWYMFSVLWHGGAADPIYSIVSRLTDMGFKPSPMLDLTSLTENGMDIYRSLCERHGFNSDD